MGLRINYLLTKKANDHGVWQLSRHSKREDEYLIEGERENKRGEVNLPKRTLLFEPSNRCFSFRIEPHSLSSFYLCLQRLFRDMETNKEGNGQQSTSTKKMYVLHP